ncbi:MAG: aminotransferase class III-fold pyridoxal phosphate-dependent enzyme, partial [Nitriliruptoraceae bacterium]
PDVVAFGKKTHVCGIMAGGRLDEVAGHVFATSSRINSTFGGGLVDMVRATMMLEVIESEHLIPRAAELGAVLLAGLRSLEAEVAVVTAARGRGLFCAIDLPDTAIRDAVVHHLFVEERAFVLGCGTRSLRFRPPLTVTADELVDGLARVERAIRAVTEEAAPHRPIEPIEPIEESAS